MSATPPPNIQYINISHEGETLSVNLNERTTIFFGPENYELTIECDGRIVFKGKTLIKDKDLANALKKANYCK